MQALQMFFYATVGLLALVLLVERVRFYIKSTIVSLERRKTQALKKRFHDAFESVQTNVELWWEDRGRSEMQQDSIPILEMMPEALKQQVLDQHADTIKRAAMQLAGGLVLREDGKLSSSEIVEINREIDILRQQLIDHGIDTDSFEKLFA